MDILKEVGKLVLRVVQTLYVLTMLEKLAKMSELPCENILKAQQQQKHGYD